MIVEHRITGLQGRVRDRADRFSRFDGEPGPWSYVEFDDGFTCWVPDSVLRTPRFTPSFA